MVELGDMGGPGHDRDRRMGQLGRGHNRDMIHEGILRGAEAGPMDRDRCHGRAGKATITGPGEKDMGHGANLVGTLGQGQ